MLVRADATFLLELGIRDWRGSNVPQLPCHAGAVGVIVGHSLWVVGEAVRYKVSHDGDFIQRSEKT